MVLELNTHLWKEFKVSDIFVCETTKALDVDEIIDGNIPYITRSAVKNGCSGKLENVEGKINKLNCITIGAEGKFAFYQDQDFLAGVKIYTLRNKNLNKYNALFLCTVLNQHVYKYSYGRARVLDKIKNEYIKLPVDKKGEPDFIFMENYIKELWGGVSKNIYKILENPIKHQELERT